MPHKDPESTKRKKGKDKMRERKNRNGKFTTKHVRNHVAQREIVKKNEVI
jgi:hypothetical protein|tara:strand:+ start:404 stop:553 length:150 start_codon:yes stop_codon:yes gene_type:complete